MTETGKGRPTPKRRDSERKRVKRSLAPATTREAMREQRAEAKRVRMAQREAWVRGDERALPARDRGPAKRIAREMVDSRRNVGEYLLPLVFAVLLMSMIQSRQVQGLATALLYTIMIWAIADTALLVRRVKARVRSGHPDESVKGLNSYVALRASQIRRLRIPRPLVERASKKG